MTVGDMLPVGELPCAGDARCEPSANCARGDAHPEGELPVPRPPPNGIRGDDGSRGDEPVDTVGAVARDTGSGVLPTAAKAGVLTGGGRSSDMPTTPASGGALRESREFAVRERAMGLPVEAAMGLPVEAAAAPQHAEKGSSEREGGALLGAAVLGAAAGGGG